MDEEIKRNVGEARTFEEVVFAHFDGLERTLKDFDIRMQVLEAKSNDTKPIWERVLNEIVETRRELTETRRDIRETRRELSKRLDRIDAIVHEDRADLRDVEDRLEVVESRLPQ